MRAAEGSKTDMDDAGRNRAAIIDRALDRGRKGRERGSAKPIGNGAAFQIDIHDKSLVIVTGAAGTGPDAAPAVMGMLENMETLLRPASA
jgi:hypothetical protein